MPLGVSMMQMNAIHPMKMVLPLGIPLSSEDHPEPNPTLPSSTKRVHDVRTKI